MIRIKEKLLKVEWKQIICDIAIAVLLDFLIVDSFIVGNLPEIKENWNLYWMVINRVLLYTIIIIFLFRFFKDMMNGKKPYIKSTTVHSLPVSCYSIKAMENIKRNTIEQGEKVRVVLLDGDEYIGTAYKIVLGINKDVPTQASIFLSEDKSEHMKYGQVHIYCEDLKSIEKVER